MDLNTKTALVLGATGGIGGAVAARLLARGWTVRALARDLRKARMNDRLRGVQWIAGDAMHFSEVQVAAEDAALIVHAVNPPGYRDWDKLVLPMLVNSTAAALANDARLLLPGTIYNYGPDAPPKLGEEAPQTATTRKGRIRIAMEQTLQTSGAKTLIVRAGDFFGPGAGNSWFAQVVRSGRPLTHMTDPATRGVGHAWAYLPDLAEAMVALAEREPDLPRFARFHFAGHHFGSGDELAEALARAARLTALPRRTFPWPIVLALAPFVRLFAELVEVRGFWRRDIAFDNRRLVEFLGAEPHTPVEIALRDSLKAMGALPSSEPDLQPALA